MKTRRKYKCHKCGYIGHPKPIEPVGYTPSWDVGRGKSNRPGFGPFSNPEMPPGYPQGQGKPGFGPPGEPGIPPGLPGRTRGREKNPLRRPEFPPAQPTIIRPGSHQKIYGNNENRDKENTDYIGHIGEKVPRENKIGYGHCRMCGERLVYSE